VDRFNNRNDLRNVVSAMNLDHPVLWTDGTRGRTDPPSVSGPYENEGVSLTVSANAWSRDIVFRRLSSSIEICKSYQMTTHEDGFQG
jgi:hypothetical protein